MLVSYFVTIELYAYVFGTFNVRNENLIEIYLLFQITSRI